MNIDNEVRDSIFHLGVISDQLSAEVLRIFSITKKIVQFPQVFVEIKLFYDEIFEEIESLISLADWVEEVSVQLKKTQVIFETFEA